MMDGIISLLIGCMVLAALVVIGCMAFQFILTLVMLVIAGIVALFQWLWGLVVGRE